MEISLVKMRDKALSKHSINVNHYLCCYSFLNTICYHRLMENRDGRQFSCIHMYTHTHMFSHTQIYIHKQVKDSVISTTVLHFKGIKSNTGFFFLIQRLRIQSNLMKTLNEVGIISDSQVRSGWQVTEGKASSREETQYRFPIQNAIRHYFFWYFNLW